MKIFLWMCALFVLPQPASALVIYTSQAEFLAVTPDVKGYTFPFPYDPWEAGLPDYYQLPNPYLKGPLTITAGSNLYHYADYGEYLGGYNGITVSLAGTRAIGFVYGSYFTAPDVQVLVNGQLAFVDPYVWTGPEAFIGFSSDELITSVTFRGGTENDLYEVLVSSAVPEPATWLTMIGGFGMIGVSLRSHRTAKTQIA